MRLYSAISERLFFSLSLFFCCLTKVGMILVRVFVFVFSLFFFVILTVYYLKRNKSGVQTLSDGTRILSNRPKQKTKRYLI